MVFYKRRSEFIHLLSTMKSDKITETVKHDRGLMHLGTTKLKKVGLSRSANVRQKLRELSRLLLILKESHNGSEELEFYDFIHPKYFDDIVKCVKKLCEADDEEKSERGCPLYGKPSLALKLGHSLKKLAEVKRAQAIRNDDVTARKEADDYMLLHENEWAENVSTHATQTLVERKFNEPCVLPLTEDIVKLREFVMRKMEESIKVVKQNPNPTTWRELAMATLCRVTVFNKRRGGETGQMLMASYIMRSKDTGGKEIVNALQPIERRLINR